MGGQVMVVDLLVRFLPEGLQFAIKEQQQNRNPVNNALPNISSTI